MVFILRVRDWRERVERDVVIEASSFRAAIILGDAGDTETISVRLVSTNPLAK